MFINLKTEMDKHGITTNDIAQAVGKDEPWAQNALQEKAFLSVEAAITIKKAFFPSASYEYLFNREKNC